MSAIISGGGKIFNSLQWKIIFIYLMLILFSLQLISVYLVQSLEQYYLRNYQDSLENQARLLAAFIKPGVGDGEDWAEDAVTLALELRDLHDVEITILDSFAHVLGTSSNQAMIGRRLIRDEITRALTGNPSISLRFDPVGQVRRYYLAYPLQNEQSTIGVIYLSGSLELIDDTLSEVKIILLTGVILALVVSFLLGVVLTKTITVPIQEVTDQAFQMARGDYSRKIAVHAPDEIGKLGETFNYLAEQLSQTIDGISSEKSKVEAIVNNMNDGVVALDGKGYLIQINPSARVLLKKLDLKVPSLNRSGFNLLRRMIGTGATRQFVRGQQPLTAEVSGSGSSCTMEVRVASFKAEKGKLDGTLIVLHDVTKEREMTRRQEEFVADVSHELRTPLATVKSYVETLLDGAVEEPDVRTRFLNVLSRETDRMVSMVKDLLVLSQMDSNRPDWGRTEVDLACLAREAADQFNQNNHEQQIRVQIDSGFPLVDVDRDKVMRVFMNLLGNALRYGKAKNEVIVTAQVDGDLAMVSVKDEGIGIPENELPHVFERFYRVEKTRSRDYGGTGLGLSIARKIVEAHGGTIGIESRQGNGTRVWFTLPLAPAGEVFGDD